YFSTLPDFTLSWISLRVQNLFRAPQPRHEILRILNALIAGPVSSRFHSGLKEPVLSIEHALQVLWFYQNHCLVFPKAARIHDRAFVSLRRKIVIPQMAGWKFNLLSSTIDVTNHEYIDSFAP
ncbi:hypothetical protein TorRG33x02_354200, partial [Trema orientale]